ncbi:MAG: hypothetical protein ABIO24_08110 [Saprospiraceae bacterium]
MEEIRYRLIERNLEDLKGLSLKGNIPLSESLVNELLQNWLAGMETPASGGGDNSFAKILQGLSRKDVRIELDKNVATIVLDIGKD